MSSAKEKFKSAIFALKLAWKVNKKVFMAWIVASTVLSVLPAIVLILNRNVVSTLSMFLASGEGVFGDVVGSILLLGLFIAVNGLSGRVNYDLIYMMMYDTYYYGMGEQFMNKRQKVTREYLLDKAVRDEMQSTSMKYSTLNSFMTGLVAVVGKGGIYDLSACGCGKRFVGDLCDLPCVHSDRLRLYIYGDQRNAGKIRGL